MQLCKDNDGVIHQNLKKIDRVDFVLKSQFH
jgi:hypothetical protein